MSSQLPRLGLMGITGVGQMAPAAQSILSRAGGGTRSGRVNGGRKRKRNGTKKKAARASGARKRKRKNGGARKAYMVKGSAAAKKHMAMLRRKRK